MKFKLLFLSLLCFYSFKSISQSSMWDDVKAIMDKKGTSERQIEDFNAWQCRICGRLSRSTQKPAGYSFGGCYKESGHDWRKAKTNHGFQCNRCGVQDFIITDGYDGPCCGAFKYCKDGESHSYGKFYWTEF